MSKLILCAALTGALTPKSKNSNLPVTTKEIIRSAYDCWNAGVTMVHLHVRDENQSPSLDYDRYKEVIEGIRQKCNVLICISTSNFGVNISDDDRLKLLDLNADVASLAFGNLIRENGSITNSKYYIEKGFKKMTQKNTKPEIEIFNREMYNAYKEFVLNNVTITKPYIQLVFGSPGGMSADYKNVLDMIEEIPQNWIWSAAAVGKMQLPVNIITMLNGGQVVRTGMEDNIYYNKGELAESNAQLVERLVRLSREFGREIANSMEAKQILF